MLVLFYPYITVGFAKHAVDKIEINAAYSANYKRAFSGEWPHISVDHPRKMDRYLNFTKTMVYAQRTVYEWLKLMYQGQTRVFDHKYTSNYCESRLQKEIGVIPNAGKRVSEYLHYVGITTPDKWCPALFPGS